MYYDEAPEWNLEDVKVGDRFRMIAEGGFCGDVYKLTEENGFLVLVNERTCGNWVHPLRMRECDDFLGKVEQAFLGSKSDFEKA